MSESFVDLSYRGLALGKRIKLTQVRAASGYLEIPTPMPVGTTISIATDDGVALEALVTEIYEQVGGAERPPGMVVTPKLDDASAGAWWQARESAAPEIDEAPVSSPVPTVADEGRTMVMAAVVVPESGPVDVPIDPPVEDDGKRTMMMDAVDLAALGLASQSQQMAAVTPDDYSDDDNTPAPSASDSSPGTKSTKKKRKRR